MSFLASWRTAVLAVIVAVLACGCGGGGGGGGGGNPAPSPQPSPPPATDPPPAPPPAGDPPPPSPPPPAGDPPPSPPPVGSGVVITGTVFAGFTAGATVAAYAADAGGQPAGAPLASTQTDGNGNYTLRLASAPAGPLLLVSSGGGYVSEADGSAQPGATFAVLAPAVPAAGMVAQLNPLTTAIAARATRLMVGTHAGAAAAVADATATVRQRLGMAAMTGDPAVVAPQPGATAGDAWWLSALAGSLEQLRAATGIAPGDLYRALADDLSDGTLDGTRSGRPVALGGGVLQASLFTSELSGAASAYGAGHGVYRTALASISAALQTSAQADGVVIGSSGSVAPLQTQAGGTQIYFAARTDGLVRLDMSDPDNPRASRMDAINRALLTDAGGAPFDSVDGIVINPTPVMVNGAPKVLGIVFSYASPVIAVVNLSDGVVAGTATLPVSGMASFSGAMAFVAGGIADGQRGLVWLATGDGLLGVDPANLSRAPVLIAQPPGTSINENIGGDPAANLVFSPDYASNGLVVFNLAEGRAYVMDGAAWQGLTAGSDLADAGELDAAALDSRYKLALVTPEAGTTAALVGYATPGGANGATGRFAPTRFKAVPMPGFYAGAAIEPVSHTALFVGEGGGLGVGVLDDPANPGWQGFSAFVSAGGSYEFEPHDPHTVGVFNINGRPYGFLLQGHGPYQLVALDLAAMLVAPSSGGALLNDPLADPSVAKLLAY